MLSLLKGLGYLQNPSLTATGKPPPSPVTGDRYGGGQPAAVDGVLFAQHTDE